MGIKHLTEVVYRDDVRASMKEVDHMITFMVSLHHNCQS